MSTPVRPDSSNVGTFGTDGSRFLPVTAIARILPASICARAELMPPNCIVR